MRRFVANSATASKVAASRACTPGSGTAVAAVILVTAVLQHDAADVVHLLGVRPSIRVYGSGMAASSSRNWPKRIQAAANSNDQAKRGNPLCKVPLPLPGWKKAFDAMFC